MCGSRWPDPEALAKYATAVRPAYGEVYAYEVDGFGNQLFQGDVPSLLALPYLGCCKLDDLVYVRTRKLVLSGDNPYFFRGKSAEVWAVRIPVRT